MQKDIIFTLNYSQKTANAFTTEVFDIHKNKGNFVTVEINFKLRVTIVNVFYGFTYNLIKF